MATGIIIVPKIIADALSTASSVNIPDPVTSEDVKTFFDGVSNGKVPYLHFDKKGTSVNMYGIGAKTPFGHVVTFLNYPSLIGVISTNEDPNTCTFLVNELGGE